MHSSSREVDWPLLTLLARADAALGRPEPPPGHALPRGLDLHNPGDMDWLSSVVEQGGDRAGTC